MTLKPSPTAGLAKESTCAGCRTTAKSTAAEIRDLCAEVAEFQQADAGNLADHLAHWLTAQYVLAAKSAADQAGKDGCDLKTLRSLCTDVVALRKGDHSATRLEIDRARVKIEQERTETAMRKQFNLWLKDPATRKGMHGEHLSPEERDRRIRQIFGLSEKPADLSRETLEPLEGEAPLLWSHETRTDPIQSESIPPNPTFSHL